MDVVQEIEVLLGRQAVEKLDFEALEVAIRNQVLQLAGRAIEQRLNADTSDFLRVVRQARKPLREILETMSGRVRLVIRQTKARVFQGTPSPDKIISEFEPHTEIIRKGKTSKPNEFGNLVKVQESENEIFTHYEVFAERPEDSRLLVPRSRPTPASLWAATTNGCCRHGLLQPKKRKNHPGAGSEARRGAESEYH